MNFTPTPPDFRPDARSSSARRTLARTPHAEPALSPLANFAIACFLFGLVLGFVVVTR